MLNFLSVDAAHKAAFAVSNGKPWAKRRNYTKGRQIDTIDCQNGKLLCQNVAFWQSLKKEYLCMII